MGRSAGAWEEGSGRRPGSLGARALGGPQLVVWPGLQSAEPPRGAPLLSVLPLEAAAPPVLVGRTDKVSKSGLCPWYLRDQVPGVSEPDLPHQEDEDAVSVFQD